MPRPKTIPDEVLLDAGLDIVHRFGPGALSFATLSKRVGLASSTIVQRFGTKEHLLRATLLRAWDHLDAATDAAMATAGPGAAGVVDLLVSLSGGYEASDLADQLLVLREDLRDPALRARGAAWIAKLATAIGERLDAGPDLGELVVAHWQGALTVWAFTNRGSLRTYLRRSLEDLLARTVPGRPGPPRARRQRGPNPRRGGTR